MKSILCTLYFFFITLLVLQAQPDSRLKQADKSDSTVNGIKTDSTLSEIKTDSTLGVVKTNSIAQVDLIDILRRIFRVGNNNDNSRENRRVHFSLFPSASQTGKTSLTSFNASFLLGDPESTNVSNVFFYPYIAFGGQYGFIVQPFIFLRNNSWNFTGDYFILNYPQYTWGLGGNSQDDQKTMVRYKHFRIHQKAYKEIFTNFSVGLGYALDAHFDIQVETNEGGFVDNTYFAFVKDKTTSSGIMLPLLYDSRHNAINPQQGFTASFTYNIYTKAMGSDDNWQSLFLDVRKYLPLFEPRRSILAFRGYYWTIVNGTVPYLDLPSVRWEPIPGQASRGIQQNRYKSNALMFFETEYRFGITANGFIGGVVFGSVTSASEFNTQKFLYWHPAGGVGVRMKFNKYSDTNVSFDVAISRGFFNVYLFIGEAF
jgi:hypothetical protein